MTAEFIQYAKDVAQAERELKIEHWVFISFEIRHPDRTFTWLHSIDLPRRMLDQWRWVIEWRRAKLVCQHPRQHIEVYHSYYDKRSGLITGIDSLLGKLTAAKAQITKVERAIARYIDHETHNNLFFVEATDERLQAAQAKLERKKQNYTEALDVLRQAVEEHRNRPGTYKLYIGFRPLGVFNDIPQARQYAERSGLSGIFNLTGEKGYRDSWHVSQIEVQPQKQAI